MSREQDGRESDHILRLLKGPRFLLGQILATPGAMEAINREEITKALHRHHRGDWGLVGKEDWKANDRALEEGTRLLSVYAAEDSTRFWIITEADRSATTILLPDEY